MPPLWVKVDVDMQQHPKLFGRKPWERCLWLGLICIAKKHFAETGVIRDLGPGDLNKKLNLEVDGRAVSKTLAYFEKVGLVRLGKDGAITLKDFLEWNEPMEARDRSMVVYFIRDTKTGLIKIGSSKNPWARLAQLRTTIPTTKLEMVATIVESGLGDENDIHSLFAEARANGEWFKPTQELLAFIRDHGKPAKATGSHGSPATVAAVAPGEGEGEGEGELDQDLDPDREGEGGLGASVASPAEEHLPPSSVGSVPSADSPELQKLAEGWPPEMLGRLKLAFRSIRPNGTMRPGEWISFLRQSAAFPPKLRVEMGREYLDRGCAKNQQGEKYLLGMLKGERNKSSRGPGGSSADGQQFGPCPCGRGCVPRCGKTADQVRAESEAFAARFEAMTPAEQAAELARIEAVETRKAAAHIAKGKLNGHR